MAGSRLSEECATVSGICGILPALYPEVCRCRDAVGAFDREGCAVCVGHQLFSCFPGFTCFTGRRPILAFQTETGQYILDTDASNFGLGGVLSQIQDDRELVVAYCSRALRPSQRRYCTTKREMLAVVAMCLQFRSYLRGAR